MTPIAYLEAIRAAYAQFDAAFELHQPLSPEDTALTLGKLELPHWLAELWRVADGGPSWQPVFTRPNYFTGADFLPLAEALALRDRLRGIAGNFVGWQEDKPRDPRVRPGWFLDGWVPFAAFGGSTIVLFADCDPAPGGLVGQVIAYVHDPDQITLLAPDGESYLAQSLAWFLEQAEEFVPEE
ncbi:SMI1/KNR4 family protein [Altererythrobacter xixiisoli]|uniref:SMI1/KNR4 family protein n=1 Tax=Croceibacterium xixiisoli TaxID=1476466 RepID=A0A6I4TXE4_9SPHN|nr:SMI1/KNR4 family protein [Croceibacterium xixiisoli]MXO99839.1 SMI1/KNR4 family protein [Croceibacterium xixiisoli]